MVLFSEFASHGPPFEFQDGLPCDIRSPRDVEGGDPPVGFPTPDRDVTAPNSAAPRADSLYFRYIFCFIQFHDVCLSYLSTGMPTAQTDAKWAQTGVSSKLKRTPKILFSC